VATSTIASNKDKILKITSSKRDICNRFILLHLNADPTKFHLHVSLLSLLKNIHRFFLNPISQKSSHLSPHPFFFLFLFWVSFILWEGFGFLDEYNSVGSRDGLEIWEVRCMSEKRSGPSGRITAPHFVCWKSIYKGKFDLNR
jgi:hypothetical protein